MLGAELLFFSPLADQPVPAQADALYLPGGYPELHAATLSTAQCWTASVRAAHAAGMPILAECGGMMALTEGLVDHDGKHWPMAGLLSGEVHMQKNLQHSARRHGIFLTEIYAVILFTIRASTHRCIQLRIRSKMRITPTAIRARRFINAGICMPRIFTLISPQTRSPSHAYF
jgi:cobyrinic acid a,c-diamide synthase